MIRIEKCIVDRGCTFDINTNSLNSSTMKCIAAGMGHYYKLDLGSKRVNKATHLEGAFINTDGLIRGGKLLWEYCWSLMD